MSASVLKICRFCLKPIAKGLGLSLADWYHVDDGDAGECPHRLDGYPEPTDLSEPKAEDKDALVAALRAEIANLTLLSDSQLANQERLTESREFWKDGWHALDEEKRDIEAQLSTLRANQERLVGEMQELRQVVKEYKTSPKRDHRRCKIWEIGGVDTRCPTCVKADALLAKDIHTEPTCLCVIGCSVNGTCPIHGDDAIRAPYRTQERTSSGKSLIPVKWLQNETSWRISR